MSTPASDDYLLPEVAAGLCQGQIIAMFLAGRDDDRFLAPGDRIPELGIDSVRDECELGTGGPQPLPRPLELMARMEHDPSDAALDRKDGKERALQPGRQVVRDHQVRASIAEHPRSQRERDTDVLSVRKDNVEFAHPLQGGRDVSNRLRCGPVPLGTSELRPVKQVDAVGSLKSE